MKSVVNERFELRKYNNNLETEMLQLLQAMQRQTDIVCGEALF